jgi:hypothetical protein
VIDHQIRSRGIGGRTPCGSRECPECHRDFTVYADYAKQKHCSHKCSNGRQGNAGMRNRVEVRGDVTVIFIERKGVTHECLIDTQDLPKVKALGRSWRARWSRESNTFYAVAHDPSARGRGVQMHRLILDAPESLQVDHIHHNGLDNRRAEMMLATSSQNVFNRRDYKKGVAKCRGVSWDSHRQRWIVKFNVNKKAIRVGSFLDVNQAKAAAIAFLESTINRQTNGGRGCQ